MAGPQPEALSNLMNSILVMAEECLIDAGLEVPSQVFVSHGEPPADCCDALSVWVRSLRPGSSTFPIPQTTPARCGELSTIVDVSLRLDRPCFPTLKNSKVAPFPTADEMQTAADALLVDARVLWCCLQAAQEAHTLLPEPFNDVVWGPMTPHRSSDCAGWRWDFTVEGPGCCWVAPTPSPSGS